MKSTTFLATTTAALFSTTHASTITLETTRCPSNNAPVQHFSIDADTASAVPVDLPQICGLRILSVSADVDLFSLSCRAYKDAAGTTPGSAVFTYDSPALIATNPVSIQSVHCSTAATTTDSEDAELSRRQFENDNGTATLLPSISTATPLESASIPVFITVSPTDTTVVNTASDSVPSSSVSNDENASGSESSQPPRSTIVQTVIASASSGLPSNSANATVPANTGRPSATQSQEPAQSSNAAVKIGGVSLSLGGVLVGGLVAAVMG